MGFMFYGCSSLESIDLNTFNTSKVIDMTQLFNGCKSIKKLNLENLDVKLLKGDMKGGYYMFAYCSSLEELHISNWDVSNIRLMNGMFKNCSSLQILDLSGWNIEKVINVSEMFDSCTKLKTIYISDKWGDNSQVQNSGKMFFGCVNLSGAIKFEANKIDITYANYKTGYFTYKEAK